MRKLLCQLGLRFNVRQSCSRRYVPSGELTAVERFGATAIDYSPVFVQAYPHSSVRGLKSIDDSTKLPERLARRWTGELNSYFAVRDAVCSLASRPCRTRLYIIYYAPARPIFPREARALLVFLLVHDGVNI